MFRKFLIVISLISFAQCTMAREVIIEKNIDNILQPASARLANATCFIYPGNDYKCACRFSDNSVLWASKEISQIKGITKDVLYGNIEMCNSVTKKHMNTK